MRRSVSVGVLLGLLYGVCNVAYGYLQAPGVPGAFELALQVVIIGLCGAVGAVLGLVVGLVIRIALRGR